MADAAGAEMTIAAPSVATEVAAANNLRHAAPRLMLTIVVPQDPQLRPLAQRSVIVRPEVSNTLAPSVSKIFEVSHRLAIGEVGSEMSREKYVGTEREVALAGPIANAGGQLARMFHESVGDERDDDAVVV